MNRVSVSNKTRIIPGHFLWVLAISSVLVWGCPDVPTDPCDGIDCGVGEECVEGVCVEIDPCDDVTCEQGETCIDGECVAGTPECTEDSDCEEGETCVEGECVAPGCTMNSECDDGDPCTTNACVILEGETEGTCVFTNMECGEGEICVEGECVPVDDGDGEVLDLGALPDDFIAALDVQSEITAITIDSPPVLTFTVTTANGARITGIGALWEESNRYVRFTLTKLLPGMDGDPSTWIAYTRDTTNDGSTPPDYDTGSSLVDHGDGSYTFTFNTDVDNVSGVSYEPTRTHRVAGQIGSRSEPLEAQNLVLDFVPDGSEVTETRNIAVMDSCNDCHDGLVFHGRRFVVEYCVNCHTPELAVGEGNFPSMIHKIHSAQAFDVLDDGIDYSEVTYPQDLANCSKCHSGDLEATVDGDNWKNVPSMDSCGSCHRISFVDPPPEGLTLHTGGTQSDNSACTLCHPAASIEEYHTIENPTPNNPLMPDGVPAMAFSVEAAVVGGSRAPMVTFTVTADGEVLDMNDLPDGFVDGDGNSFRWPVFLMAWASEQDGIMPADYNNLGRTAGQPMSLSLGDLVEAGAVDCSSTNCVADFSVTDTRFPAGAEMRAVALQGYFRFDADGDESYDYSLHTLSAVQPVSGDEVRREIVDSNKCGDCHEWFEGHGGNRVIGTSLDPEAPSQPNVCALCHVPSLSASARAIDPAAAADRDGDPETDDPSQATVALGNSDTWTWPEDTNNLKDMIHGIHASAVRTTEYEFVRGRNDGIYYNWAEVTFPAENGVRNCLLCHLEGTYNLPLADNLLDTTVRITGTDDGLDGDDFVEVGTARDGMPNATDWVNTPTASTCFMCHTSATAVVHIRQNGGIISIANPEEMDYTQRQFATSVESCDVCHAVGRIADVSVAHQVE
ncbi:MAG: OmcA/MtrC family decaheme c-type cytochrome [Planctomycetota bacterium]|jgi:OmcA/MtrC family decaheme c-type cytochrome